MSSTFSCLRKETDLFSDVVALFEQSFQVSAPGTLISIRGSSGGRLHWLKTEVNLPPLQGSFPPVPSGAGPWILLALC